MEQFEKFEKNSAAVLDYKFDWVNWLFTDETIATKTITASTGITVASSTIAADGKSVTVWLSGGTLGITYQIDCLITTATQTEKRSILIEITDR